MLVPGKEEEEMKDAKKGVWVICCLAWACISAAPCLAQAPDQDPTAQIRVPVGVDTTAMVGPGAVRAGTRAWGPEQATGAPDTDRAGDIPTAWASLEPDGGIEWLQVEFDQAVTIAEVRIRETFNPGAVSKVTAILQGGREHVLWEGVDHTAGAPADFTVKAGDEVVSRSVKVYLDTARVQGWNEIDAVELVGKDGKRQWASRASASSTYAAAAAGYGGGVVRAAEPMPGGMGTAQVVFGPMPDPFAGIVQKQVIVHLDGDKSVAGLFVRTTPGFIVIEQPAPHKTLIVNVQKIVYLETVE
jgi:hypothetical protein